MTAGAPRIALLSLTWLAVGLATSSALAQQVAAPAPYVAPQPGLPQPGLPHPGFLPPGYPHPGFPQPGFPQHGVPQQGFPGAAPTPGSMPGGTWSWPPQGSAWPVQPGAQEIVAPDLGQSQPVTPGAPTPTHVPGFVRTPGAPAPQPQLESRPPQ